MVRKVARKGGKRSEEGGGVAAGSRLFVMGATARKEVYLFVVAGATGHRDRPMQNSQIIQITRFSSKTEDTA